MSVMTAFGLASIMICLGMALRSKIGFFRNMLVPVTVIAGVLGLIFMNVTYGKLDLSVDSSLYTDIVNQLFTLSFISIGLTKAPKKKHTEGEKKDSAAKNIAKGSMGLGLVWCVLYGLTPAIGAIIIGIVGKAVSMDKAYGLLIPFGFCQGPGQAATYGAIYEQYGWANASTVGVTFAACGFLSAFLIGVPIAKLGLKLGISKHSGKMNESVSRGYFTKEEQRESMGKVTTYGGSLETLSFHMALMGLSYICAVIISKGFSLLPGFLGTTMSGMMFMCGMLGSYVVNFGLKKLKIEHLHNDVLQGKITGFCSDYLVVCAFMAVSLNVVGSWIVPIVIESIVVALITACICIYFGQRFGGENDFERTLGLFGTSTGTVPSGIALIRMVDPRLETTTATELGMMNFPMMFCTLSSLVMMAGAAGAISINLTIIILLACTPIYIIAMKVSKLYGEKTYSFNKKWIAEHTDINAGKESVLKGTLTFAQEK